MKLPKFLLYPLGFLVLGIGIVRAGQMSMSTYYPSPSGNYKNLTVANTLGIGTTVPVTKLDVHGTGAGAAPATTGATDSTINFRAGRGNAYVDMGIIDNGTGYLQNRNITDFATNYNFVLEPNGGNVGIGSTAPGEQLDVSGYIRANNEIIGTGFGPSGTGGQFRMIGGNYGAFFRNDGTTTYLLLTASLDQYGGYNALRPFYVDNSTGNASMGSNLTVTGKVGIGTVAGGNGKLYVSSASTTDWGAVIISSSVGGVFVQATPSRWVELLSNAYGIDTSSDIHAGGVVSQNSDLKLKQNIMPLTSALDKVQRLNGVAFTWKKTGIKDIGVIGQNVEKVLPEIVHTGQDGMKSVEYGNLAALFIEAFKEQQKEIKEQQNEIKEQQKEIKDQRKEIKDLEKKFR